MVIFSAAHDRPSAKLNPVELRKEVATNLLKRVYLTRQKNEKFVTALVSRFNKHPQYVADVTFNVLVVLLTFRY